MKRKIFSILFVLVLVFSLAAVVVTAGPVSAATTYTVDDDWQIGAPPYAEDTDGDNDFATIQAAINATSSGDTVYVRSGTYYEHVTIGKSLTLQGEDKDTTAIDGSASENVIYITANHVTINGLKVTNGDYGINLIANWTIHHITIRDVIITLNSIHGFYSGHSGGYHLIEDCIISNNNEKSIAAHQFGNSIIRNCEVFDNGDTLLVGWGSGTLITNNRIHHNGGIGIAFDSMSYSTIEKNEVYNNRWGITVGYVGTYNTIRENIVHHNTVGIEMNYSGVYGNKIYHNDLIENTTQAHDYGTNFWDNGYPSGGNYWSDYTGQDLYQGPGQNVPGSDGIGDTPYAFTGNQDNYPLMGAAEPDTTSPSAITDLATSGATTSSVTLTWTAPGDDGNVGTASQYDIRYSTSTIAEANWSLATECTGEPSPKPAGSSESFVVTSLSSDTTYYFALKTADEVPNWSDLSNVPSGATSADGEGCFIATAAYGTSTIEELDTLRDFRDAVLLQNSLGSQLVALYYEVSPPVADFISEHEGLRTLVREVLVEPVAWLVEATGSLWGD